MNIIFMYTFQKDREHLDNPIFTYVIISFK